MKSLEELKEMRNKWLKNYEGTEYYEEFKSYNFVSYNVKDNSVICHKNYNEARSFAEEGGQILVLNNDKIYTYKIKTDEEYYDYIENQVRSEGYSMMNRYGL